MKFSSTLSTLLVAASTVNALPGQPIEKRQNGGSVAITGVQGQGTQPRKELRKMQSDNPDQFNLYLLALRRLMTVQQSDPLSYYQIAGIHGRPYIPWDNQWSFAGPNGFGGGYCTHASNLFLTWHRPYLALLEQTLFSHAQIIANSFPADRRQRYINALNGFRLPYWDWAAPAPCSTCTVYPRLVSSSTISVDTPEAGTQTRANPLFRYDFQGSPGNDFVYEPFATWTFTRRWPTSQQMPAAANAQSQDSRVTTTFTNSRRGFADRVYNLMTNQNNFTRFSTSSWTGNTGNIDSLESIHDSVHGALGNGGHMTYLDYSAFDPVFFLHHVNVDRLWAIWSTLNPNTFVENQVQRGSTYTIPAGWTRDATSSLQPFSKNTNYNLFTSNDVRTTDGFGYTYPEIQTTDLNTIRNSVRTLYGPNSPATVNSRKMKRDLSTLSKRDDGHEYHYVANIAAQRFQGLGTFGVFLFDGEPPADPADYIDADNSYGYQIFLADASGNKDVDLLVQGTVTLTADLHAKADAGDKDIKDMDPKTVEPYLKKNLTWRVLQYNTGKVVPNEQVKDLSVSVVVTDVTPDKSLGYGQLPTWYHSSNLEDVTKDKAGGFIAKFWDDVTKRWSVGEYINGGVTGRASKYY